MADFSHQESTDSGNRTPSTPVAEALSCVRLADGFVIDGRYKIASLIGEGGMAIVYKVERLYFQDVCALKVAKYSIAQASGQRFQKEAIAARSLEHPNLLRVYDFGILNGEFPYFVMDYLKGRSLSQILKNNGPLNLQEAGSIFTQLAAGMMYAHNQGLIHRDLKPSNIMLVKNADGSTIAKVVDFGLVKILESETEQNLTRTGEVFGSPPYMSPEQCQGTPVDNRADIYSFGCTLFEALTGTKPFLGENALVTMLMHRDEKPPTLREAALGVDFSEDLENLMSELLAKDPNDRPQSFEEVNDRLQSALESKRFRDSSSQSEISTTVREPFPLKTLAIITASVLFVGAILASFLLLPQSNDAGKTSTEVDQKIEPAVDISQTLGIPDPKPPKPFCHVITQNGMKWKVFKFPKDRTLGELYFVDHRLGTVGHYEASGTVTLPFDRPLGFRAFGDSIRHPTLLKGFSSDDIVEISFAKQYITDAVMFDIDQLKSLETLDLELSSLTDSGLAVLGANFPKLANLSLASSGELTAGAIAKLPRLKSFGLFKAGGIPGGGTILSALKGSQTLHYLSLPDSGLSDSDLKDIDTMPKLRILLIRKNPKLTNNAISNIAKNIYVSELDVRDTAIDAASFTEFAKIKYLTNLKISTNGWTVDEQLHFKKALPGVKVEMTGRETIIDD